MLLECFGDLGLDRGVLEWWVMLNGWMIGGWGEGMHPSASLKVKR